MLMLTVITVIIVLAFVAVLAIGVAKIMWALEAIGNASTSTPGSRFARIRWGVRAIEQQSVALGPQARRLNDGLARMEGSIRRLQNEIAALPGDRISSER